MFHITLGGSLVTLCTFKDSFAPYWLCFLYYSAHQSQSTVHRRTVGGRKLLQKPSPFHTYTAHQSSARCRENFNERNIFLIWMLFLFQISISYMQSVICFGGMLAARTRILDQDKDMKWYAVDFTSFFTVCLVYPKMLPSCCIGLVI